MLPIYYGLIADINLLYRLSADNPIYRPIYLYRRILSADNRYTDISISAHRLSADIANFHIGRTLQFTLVAHFSTSKKCYFSFDDSRFQL